MANRARQPASRAIEHSLRDGDHYLLDPRGNAIASSNWREPQSLVGHNYAYRPYFVNAIEHGSASFYGIGIPTRLPGYYISQRIGSRDAPVGVVVVKAGISILGATADRGSQDVMVTDENDVVFLSSREEWKYRPLWSLAADVEKRLAQTRQYEWVLRQPISIAVAETLPQGRIVSIAGDDERGGSASYFVKSSKLRDSRWTIHLMSPLDQARRNAMHAGGIALGALALVVLGCLYILELRAHHRQQREARSKLEEAHRTLEDEHQVLQKLSEELRVRAVTDALTGAFNRRFFMDSAASVWMPEVDIREKGNALRVRVDLPGVTMDDPKVEIQDRMLVIEGERREERTEGDEQGGARFTERRYGAFYRAVPLPERADTEKAEARMKDGVLEITIPVAAGGGKRKLDIKS